MITHEVSMIGLHDYFIEVRDTTQYIHPDLFVNYGRAYFVKHLTVLESWAYQTPFAEKYVFPYTKSGKYDADTFFFPWWKGTMSYLIGDIVCFDAIIGQEPGVPGVLSGPQIHQPRLFVTGINNTGDNPMSSGSWSFLSTDEVLAYAQCNNAGNKQLVKTNIIVDLLIGERKIYKSDDYKFMVNLLDGGSYNVKIYNFNNLSVVLSEYNVEGSFEFDSRDVFGVQEPIGIMVVEVFDGLNTYFSTVFEITSLVNAVNKLMSMLYCKDCEFIKNKNTETQLTTMMALWFSILFKINHSYSKASYVGGISDNMDSLLTQVDKEMKMLEVIIKSLNHDS